MKYIFFPLFLLLLFSEAQAQIETGVSVGIRQNFNSVEEVGKYNNTEVALQKAGSGLGFHANGYLRLNMGVAPIFFQPDLTVAYSQGGIKVSSIQMNEEMPMATFRIYGSILAGLKFADHLAVYFAPTASVNVATEVKSQKVTEIVHTDEILLGWLVGVNYEHKNYIVGLRFETMFGDYGFSTIHFSDNSKLVFQSRFTELVFSVGYRFGDFKTKKRRVTRY